MIGIIKWIFSTLLFSIVIIHDVEAQWSDSPKEGTVNWYSDIEKLPSDIVVLRVALSPKSIDSCYRQEVNFSRFQFVAKLIYSPNFYNSSLKETDSLSEAYLISKLSEMRKIHSLFVQINRPYDLSGFKYAETFKFSGNSNGSCLDNPSLLKLRYLTHLEIYDASFEGTNENSPVFQLKNLKNLTVKYSPYYTRDSFGHVPYEHIGNLTSLNFLKIDDGAFSKIPDTWEKLRHLMWLDIRTSRLDSIPSFICTSSGIDHLVLVVKKETPLFSKCVFDIPNLSIHFYTDIRNEIEKSKIKHLKKQIRLKNKTTNNKLVYSFRKLSQSNENEHIIEVNIKRNY